MQTFTFEFETRGHKTYEVEAESAEAAAKLLIAAEAEGDEKYLLESEGEEWLIDAWRDEERLQKVLGHINE